MVLRHGLFLLLHEFLHSHQSPTTDIPNRIAAGKLQHDDLIKCLRQ